MAKLYGCDISHHQSDREFLEILQSNDFFIMKATEGKSFVDSKFKERVETLIKDGELVGLYHYARPENRPTLDGAIIEAKHFVENVKPYIGKVMLALDWETIAWNYDIKWSLKWLDTVYAMTGVKPIMYCHTNRVDRCQCIAEADYGLWVVYWSKNDGNIPEGEYKTGYWKFAAMWQYTSKPYDKDIFNGDEASFRKYCVSSLVEDSAVDVDTDNGVSDHTCGCELCEWLEQGGFEISKK